MIILEGVRLEAVLKYCKSLTTPQNDHFTILSLQATMSGAR